jgi:ABC-type phosphate transport system substrate-binding protein
MKFLNGLFVICLIVSCGGKPQESLPPPADAALFEENSLLPKNMNRELWQRLHGVWTEEEPLKPYYTEGFMQQYAGPAELGLPDKTFAVTAGLPLVFRYRCFYIDENGRFIYEVRTPLTIDKYIIKSVAAFKEGRAVIRLQSADTKNKSRLTVLFNADDSSYIELPGSEPSLAFVRIAAPAPTVVELNYTAEEELLYTDQNASEQFYPEALPLPPLEALPEPIFERSKMVALFTASAADVKTFPLLLTLFRYFVREYNGLNLIEPEPDFSAHIFEHAFYPNIVYNKRPDSIGLFGAGSRDELIGALLSGEKELIFISMPVQEKELPAGGDRLVSEIIGYTALVFLTDNDNPVNNLNSGRLQEIYSGALTNWRSVGGDDAAILIYQQPAEDDATAALKHLVLKDRPLMAAPAAPARYYGEDRRPLPLTGGTNVLGYGYADSLSALPDKLKLKMLAVDGVMPGRESIADGSYPYGFALYAVYNKYYADSRIPDFVGWLKTDGTAHSLLEAAGLYP